LRDKNKEDKKKYKKALKDKKLSDCRKNDNIEFLEYKIEEMRLNEEQLIEDLYHQQSLAKDAIRSLENLSKQFEVEKSQFKRQAEEQ
jgi:citrate lyase alpha subunit